MQQVESLGACLLNFFIFFLGGGGIYRLWIASDTISGSKQRFLEARWQSFTWMNVYIFCPLHWFWLSNRLLIIQVAPSANDACETNCSLGRRESCWNFCPVHNNLTSFNYHLVTHDACVCVCVWGGTLCRPPLSDHSIWWYWASHECGKCGLVETALTSVTGSYER